MANRYPPKILSLPLGAETSYSENSSGTFDGYNVNCDAGSYTLTLQSPANRGRRFITQTGSSNNLTLATAGTSATIAGASTYVMNPGDGASLVANGLTGSSANWSVVANNVGETSVTPGTVAANKAVVVGASKQVDTWTVTSPVTNALAASLIPNDSSITFTKAGTIAGGANSAYPVRGIVTITSGTTINEAFVAGGRFGVVVAGTVNQTSAMRVAAVFAKLDVSAATLTAGQVSAIWGDWGATASTPSSAECNVLRITNTTAAVINSLGYFYGKANYLFDINSNSATWAASGAATPSGTMTKLKVKVDGVDLYILAAATWS